MIQLIPEEEMVSISQWKEIVKSYKFEMIPTKKQEVKLNQTLDTCRHLYNDTLGERKDGWENGGWNVTYKDQQNHLPILRNRNDETGKYLRGVYEQVEQNVIKRVDTSYENFFGRAKNNKEGNGGQYKKPGFPRFKGRNRYRSFTFPQYGNGCDIRGEYKNKNKKYDIIRLSKIGEIKFIKHRNIGEKKDKDNGNIVIIPYWIKTCTVKKEIDKWFVIFTVDTFVEIEIPIIEKPIDLNRVTGIDLNLTNYAALDGKKIVPPKYLRESEKKLAKHQRRLSRKKIEKIEIIDKRLSKNGKEVKKKINKSSKNRNKEKIKVAKVHRKIKNQRENFSHEVSGYATDNYDLSVFEKLPIQKMMSDRKYAKSISDASWYQTQMFTKYKAEWAGKIVDFVDPENTSQECCYCGNIVKKEIWERIHQCPFCGLTIDRDFNSQIVILKRSMFYIDILKKNNVSMKDDILRRISICKGIFRDISTTDVIAGRACLSSLNRDAMIQEAPA